MIQEAVVVMTILGCGDQAQSCDLVLSPEKTWKTQAECNSAIPTILQTAQDASYPVLTASCAVRANPEPPVQVQSVKDGSIDLALEVPTVNEEVISEQTTFDEIRAKADATDLDFIAKVRASFVNIADTPKLIADKLKDVLGRNQILSMRLANLIKIDVDASEVQLVCSETVSELGFICIRQENDHVQQNYHFDVKYAIFFYVCLRRQQGKNRSSICEERQE